MRTEERGDQRQPFIFGNSLAFNREGSPAGAAISSAVRYTRPRNSTRVTHGQIPTQLPDVVYVVYQTVNALRDFKELHFHLVNRLWQVARIPAVYYSRAGSRLLLCVFGRPVFQDQLFYIFQLYPFVRSNAVLGV